MITRGGYDISGLTIGSSYVALAMVWREPDAPVVSVTADNITLGNPINSVQRWDESRVTFTATATTQRLGIVRADNRTGRTYIGGVVCTQAPYAGGYFDGDSGPDFMWESDSNASSSYYYPDKVIRSYLIKQLLAENCPLGVTPGAPVFGPQHTDWILGDPELSILDISTIVS